MDDVRESRKLVRIYSFEAEERLPPGSDAHVLGRILGQGKGDIETVEAPWRKFFELWEAAETDQDPINKVIRIEAEKLRNLWLTFQGDCPKDERLDLQKSEPTVEGLVEMVDEMNKAWHAKREKSRRGKALKVFHKFCRTLDSHSTMMEVIPKGNEYVSLFAGSISAIIKASVNHECIAEGFSQALCTISEHIVECKTELELFQTEAMKLAVADLYAHIFLFLSGTMEWLMEKRHKRLLDSFNENFNKKFETEVQNIRYRSELIRSLAAQSSRAEVRAVRLIVEEMRMDMRIGLEGLARRLAEQEYSKLQSEKELSRAYKERSQLGHQVKQLNTCIKQMLQEGAMVWIGGKHQLDAQYYVPQLESQPGLYDSHPSEVTKWSMDKVSINSKDLENFFHRDRVRLISDAFNPVMVNPDILARLSEWIESTTSQLLCLAGPYTEADDFDNPMPMTAAKFVDLADSAHVPVISYFCELRRGERLQPSNTSERQAMVALLYALIRQMAELLLPEFKTQVDLSETRFRRLDGTVESWEEALAIFSDLLGLMPDTIFCVIDGLQWLDDRSTDKYLNEMVQILRGKKLKVLFTTSGRSGCLLEMLSRSEMFQVDNLDPRHATFGLSQEIFAVI